jgi:hypothetical protein
LSIECVGVSSHNEPRVDEMETKKENQNDFHLDGSIWRTNHFPVNDELMSRGKMFSKAFLRAFFISIILATKIPKMLLLHLFSYFQKIKENSFLTEHFTLDQDKRKY